MTAEVVATGPDGVRVERVVTKGTFSLGAEVLDVENNVWLIGDDDEVLVIDPAHDVAAILAATGEREILAVVCTHAHNDHIDAAVAVAESGECEILLHEADLPLWEMVITDDWPDEYVDDGGVLNAAGIRLQVLHTPGHTPGGVCLYSEELELVFSGDTLFPGGPGATGRQYSDYDLLVDSIKSKMLTLPPDTRVLPGHGEETTISAEKAGEKDWKPPER